MKQICISHTVRHYYRVDDEETAELLAEERIQELYRAQDQDELEEMTIDRTEENDAPSFGSGFSIIEPEDM